MACPLTAPGLTQMGMILVKNRVGLVRVRSNEGDDSGDDDGSSDD